MKQLLRMLQKYPFSGLIRRAFFVLRGRVVSLRTKNPRGTALLSYTTLPFTLLNDNMLAGHSNYFEVRDMAQAFIEQGYNVDVIDHTNSTFIPKTQYSYFLDIGNNIERFAPLLPASCIKIFFATGADPHFQNTAERLRIEQVQLRRGVTLTPRRQVPEHHGIEKADVVSGLCGAFPASTYTHYQKPIHMLHVSSSHEYPLAVDKNYDDAKKHFLWFGGAGAIHKGLDIVLEAFRDMPELTLTVCGKFAGEEDFVDAYKKELYETPNIRTVGYINPASETFERIRRNCIGVVSVSCSEGCASSIVLAMHAGLIPIVNKETGIDVDSFGILLQNSTPSDLRAAVRAIAHEQRGTLKAWSYAAGTYARTNHTRAQFGKEFRAFIKTLEQKGE